MEVEGETSATKAQNMSSLERLIKSWVGKGIAPRALRTSNDHCIDLSVDVGSRNENTGNNLVCGLARLIIGQCVHFQESRVGQGVVVGDEMGGLDGRSDGDLIFIKDQRKQGSPGSAG